MSRSWPAIALLLWMGSPTAARAQVAGSLTTGTNFPTVVPTAAPAGRSEAAQLGVTVGVGETDNVNLTPDDRQAQTISTTELDFGYRRTGSALTADMAGDFDYLDYLQNAYGGQLLGRFDGQAALSLWEGRFKWVLQDAYGQTQLDPLTPTVPTNLENTNVLLTGPDFTLRPAPQTTLILSARYSLDTYQTSPYDGWQSLENAALEHALSAASTVSLHADLAQMHFDQTDINRDYDLDRFYLRYAIEGARTSIAVSGGLASSDDGGAWSSTPYAHLQATRRISAEMSLMLQAGRELTDAMAAFTAVTAGASGGIAVAPVATSTDAYVRDYASGGWQWQGHRTTLGVTARWERDSYSIDDAQDLTQGGAEAHVGRQLGAVLTADVFGTYARIRYVNEGFSETDYAAGAGLSWQAGRTLIVKLRYAHNFRGVSGGGYGYLVNAGFLTLTYQPLSDQAQAR